MPPTYYDILGVTEDASDTDIKKAYRKLSLQYHPDRNPDESAKEKIQEINAAYEILGDDSKRKQYDMERQNPFGGGNPFAGHPFGGNPFGGGMPPGMFSFGGPGFVHMSSMNGAEDMGDINNILNMVFGGGPGGMGMGGPGIRIFHQNHQQIPIKPRPLEHEIHISLEHAYSGANLEFEYDRVIIENGSRTTEKTRCNLKIHQGVQDNEIIVVPDVGHRVNGQKGDIQVRIKIITHDRFTRIGDDLHINKTVTLKEALCGFVLEILHLNGKMLRLNHSSIASQVIKPKDSKTIPGFGIIREGNTGNLVVTFDVSFPEKLTETQVETLSNLL